MARRVLAWECRYCGALKKTENICLRHEKACMKNPNPRNCILCKYGRSNDSGMSLICQKGKTCSQATSANCEYFDNKYETE